MSYAIAQSGNNLNAPNNLLTGIGSILLHALVLVVVPVLLSVMHKPQSYQRPRTFQVVQFPRQAPPSASQARPPVATKPSATPSPSGKKAAMQKEEPVQQEEQVDELAALLSEIPAPAQVSSMSGDFQYPWYLNQVQQKIERFWTPPMKKEGIAVVVSFTINGEGTVSEPVITNSCGISTLDNLAIRAVKLASPFGRLPPGFSGNELTVSCTLKPIGR